MGQPGLQSETQSQKNQKETNKLITKQQSGTWAPNPPRPQ
jgi:hypothetical protein